MLTPVLPLQLGSTSLNEAARPPGRTVRVAPVNPPTPIDSGAAQMRFDQRRPAQLQPEANFEPAASGTIFSAAVLSGALTPTPKTLGELYARIGASDIPDAMLMRLKDLQV